MYLTNGYQTFSDYRPDRSDIYATTLFDRHLKLGFEFQGQICISIGNSNWAIEIHSCYESKMLMLALIRLVIKRQNGNFKSAESIEAALVEIANHQINIRKISPITNINVNLGQADFGYEKSLITRRVKRKDGALIYAVIDYLKYINFTCSKSFIPEFCKTSDSLAHIDDVFYCYDADNKKQILFKNADRFYLINATPSIKNIELLKEVITIAEGLKTDAFIREESIMPMFWLTVSMLTRNKIRFRPSHIFEKPDGGLKIIHRPFLTTEKNFSEIKKNVIKASEILLKLDFI